MLDRLQYDTIQTDASLLSLGVNEVDVSSKLGAQGSIGRIDDALVKVNGIRANLGAKQNRLTSTINNLEVNDENMSAANSRMRDVDVAAETADLAKNQILLQSGTAVLSQANQIPSVALKLLGNG